MPKENKQILWRSSFELGLAPEKGITYFDNKIASRRFLQVLTLMASGMFIFKGFKSAYNQKTIPIIWDDDSIRQMSHSNSPSRSFSVSLVWETEQFNLNKI